jgi:hypothetical protein
MPQLTRRQFLIGAGVAGVVVVPTLALGYNAALRNAAGDAPPQLSPYAPEDALNHVSQPPLPDAPVLILIDDRAANPFGRYLTELLRTEGLTAFTLAHTTDVERVDLDPFSVILLADQSLTSETVTMLEEYVAQGGHLIALHPDPQLASLLGLDAPQADIAAGYFQMDPTHAMGQGFTAESLQFHSPAVRQPVNGAQVIAWLSDRNNLRSEFPAVTLNVHGRGSAAMWAFDPARSIALMRQGDPAKANQDLDGFDYVRAVDMFVDWIDLDRLAIPQADEQQRLLAKMITHMSADRLPLPRWWYFPGAANAMLIATSDAHQNPATAVEDILSRVEKFDGHASIYYLPPLESEARRVQQQVRWWMSDAQIGGDSYFPSPAQVSNWRARGHEFTLHPEVANDLAGKWVSYWEGFTGLGWGGISPSTRTHAVLWTGWVESARLQAQYGIRLNHDYYQIGQMFRDGQGRWLSGYFTGSGLPMRFVDEQGRLLNIYQQLTQLADDHLLKLHWTGVAELSAEDALAVARPMFDRSLTDHSVVTMQFHTDPYAHPEPHYTQAVRWLEGSLDYARSKGLPIWDSLKWLQFWEARYGAVMKDFEWDAANKRLSFSAEVDREPGAELALMLPAVQQGAALSQVLVDGQSVEHHARELRGDPYRWMSLAGGKRRVEVEYN